jgi:hypothetical protein
MVIWQLHRFLSLYAFLSCTRWQYIACSTNGCVRRFDHTNSWMYCDSAYKGLLTLSDPTSDFVRQYDFPVLPRCRKMSDTVFVAFVRPLSEPVRRFSSCSTDFSQQIAQVVLFLFVHAFLFWNCRIIASNPPTSLPPKINKNWGVCGWEKNWIAKG